MFRLFFFAIAAALVFAKDWVHYSGQSEVRDVAKTEDGTLWAAFAWGLQERAANGKITSYTPGNDGLEAADFVQIFALNNGDIIAISRNGTLVRKNKNSSRFETINNSFVGRNRTFLSGLGQIAENILILPFNNALAFFDYNTNRSVITLTQIGTSSLEEYAIKRIAVKEDSIWIDLDSFVWTRQINWNEIYNDNRLFEPTSWMEVKDKNIPVAEEQKPGYNASALNFSLERVKTISISPNGDYVIAWGNAWGNNYSHFSVMQNGHWSEIFEANQNPNGYGYDQQWNNPKSLSILPNGKFAFGMWGSGLITYDENFNASGWFHSNNSNNTCPTEWSNNEYGYTIVQGVVSSPDYSGYIFSYVSENKYGLGFADSEGKNATCAKSDEASSAVAFSVIARENEFGEWEIYAAWKSSLESNNGGVDFYKVSNPNNFKPVLNKKWPLSFGTPIDFAFDSQGILWAVSESKIFYLDNDNEWKEPSSIRGFSGGKISALETDAQNGLWIATNDGAYSFSQVNNSPENLTAKHFKTKDGLLSEAVYDIAIDTIKGKVYFAHDLGLSIFSTPLVRNASNYMQDGSPKTIAYPNPFRPSLHNSVTIDHINEKSSVHIFDSSGKRVKFFKGSDLQGGAVVWDGKNEFGKLVAPGLYYYVAKDGKKTAKGKIIIER